MAPVRTQRLREVTWWPQSQAAGQWHHTLPAEPLLPCTGPECLGPGLTTPRFWRHICCMAISGTPLSPTPRIIECVCGWGRQWGWPCMWRECAREAALPGRLLLNVPAPQPKEGLQSSKPGHQPGWASPQTSVKESKLCERPMACLTICPVDMGDGMCMLRRGRKVGRLLFLHLPGGDGTLS